MTSEDQITFRLRYFWRFDEQVHAFVGYIPRFELFAQSATEEGLEKATTAVVLRYLMACADIGTFGQLMQESRMQKASDNEVETILDSEESEFVSISGYKKSANQIKITLPFPVVAAQHATV